MFGFLKDKLKKALSVFSKKVETEVEEEEKKVKPKKEAREEKIKEKKSDKQKAKSSKSKEAKKEKAAETAAREVELEEKEAPKQIQAKKGFFSRIFGKKDKDEELVTEEEAPEEDETEEEVEDDEISPGEAAFEKGEKEAEFEEKEKKGFFAKIGEAITKTSLSEEKFENLFWDMEVVLMENNVAVEVISRIKEDLKEILVKGKISRFDVSKTILETLRKSIDDILTFESVDLLKEIKHKKPLILSFVGVNGSGKTTTIAKLAHYFLKNKKTVVLAAADTFRAAAIQQLEEHANKLGVRLIKHDYGADAAAVAFDAVKYAESKGIDVVMIDTAGRLHSNTNLMDEMKKIIRVAKPHYKIFVGESITGNDCVEQAQQFNDAIQIDGIILSKADVDEKGGAAISIAYVTKKPIMFIGTGQTYDDLKPFDKKEILKSLDL